MTYFRCILIAIALFLAACSPAAATLTVEQFQVTVVHDGETETIASTELVVRDVLRELGISLATQDRITPGEFSPLTAGMTITIVRIVEELELQEVEIPFEQQTVRNEGLPEGETRLLQTGQNGVEELTFRIVYEDGEQVSHSAVRRTVLVEPIPEIIMVGSQSTFTIIPVTGTLAYLSAGNAWVMRESSSSRQPLTISSDLDGRVFSISPEGDYLLYTRNTGEEDTFNTLWAISTFGTDDLPIDLEVENVLWADWSPTELRTVAYSSGEPRERAPGWQANNNLILIEFDEDGLITGEANELLGSSAGGIYGWYGTNFSWAPDGRKLAYAQADTIGLITLDGTDAATQFPIAAFPPFKTYSDWVWNPWLTWSPDSNILYTVLHGPSLGLEAPEDSPVFDVAAIAVDGSFDAALVSRAGMWAAPIPSPPVTERGDFQLAFLQAQTPLESVTSRYRITLIDRDGSNAILVFPPEGEPGLTPQTISWSPDGTQLAAVWNGNLWIVDVATGLAQQLTGDGQTTNPDWAP